MEAEIRQTQKEQEREEQPAAFDSIEPFAFQQVWKNYLNKVQGEHKTMLLRVLEVFTPEIIDHKVVRLLVGNETHLRILSNERENIVYFLKKELGKKAIDLRMEVDQNRPKPETERRPYTAREKYEYMLGRNAKMNDLKERLRLELDF